MALITNYNRAPLTLGDVRSRTVTIRNIEEAEVTVERGAVLGRNAAGEYVVLKSTAIDGSQYPKAILAGSVTMATEGTGTQQVFISGDFNSAGLVFDGTDTLNTLVGGLTIATSPEVDIAGQRIEDWMKGQSLFVQNVSELTDYDNQ